MKRSIRLFAVAALIVLADQLTKMWMVENLKPVGTMKFLTPFIRLTYTENTGAAFGFLSDMSARWVLVSFTFIVLCFICVIIARNKFQHPMGIVGMVFVLGGGAGNLIDRAFSGFVVDFFDFCFIRFGIFNVADIFVVSGSIVWCVYIILFDITLIKTDKNKKTEQE